MMTAIPTVAAMITFSRCPQGRSPGRNDLVRAVDVGEKDFVETNCGAPSAPSWRIRRLVASCESNAREMPLVGVGVGVPSSPESRSDGSYGGVGAAAA